MKCDTYQEDLPGYSLFYLVNGDDSGLDGEDIDAIDQFMESYYELAEEKNGHVVIDIPNDAEPFFTHWPAFGLACNCLNCNINILYP